MALGGRVVVNDDVLRACGSHPSNSVKSPNARAAS
jgi:hypothetical protein